MSVIHILACQVSDERGFSCIAEASVRSRLLFFFNLGKSISKPVGEQFQCNVYNRRMIRTRQTEEEVRRQHHGMAGPGARQALEGSGEQRKIEGTIVVKSSVVPKRPSRSGIDETREQVRYRLPWWVAQCK